MDTAVAETVVLVMNVVLSPTVGTFISVAALSLFFSTFILLLPSASLFP